MLKYIAKKLKNNKGFTLIELVVVIAILGILAAIAVPKLSNTTEKAAVAAHNANVRTLESAATMFIAENPGETDEWTGAEDDDVWKKYLQDWPIVPDGIKNADGSDATNYKVTIGDGGSITVEPDKNLGITEDESEEETGE